MPLNRLARKLVAAGLLVFAFVGAFLAFPSNALAESNSWSLSIGSIEIKAELHTTQYTTRYDGTVDEQQFDNVPSKGNCYAILTINAELDSALGNDPLSVSQLTLSIDGIDYPAVSPVSSFLANHNYATFAGDEIVSSGRGFVAFEIPSSYADSDGAGWKVSCGDVQSPEYVPLGNEVEWRSNTVAGQAETEQGILSQYQKSNKKNLSDPFVVLNPYGSAPLAALAVFETDSAEEVTVTVHGRNGSDGDISYPVSGATTHHEVPIIGLYAGCDNVVTLSTSSASSDVHITTQNLPDSVERVQKTNSSGAQKLGQLFVLQSPHQIVFDNNGNVRWYMSEAWSCKKSQHDSSYPMRLDSDGGGFWYVRNRMTSSVYNYGDEIVHMNWLGRASSIVSSAGMQCDHDLAFVDDNTALLIEHGCDNSSAIAKIDLSTGATEPWLTFNDFLDPSVTPSYFDAWNDLWHPNAVQYLPEDNSVLISVRNQSTVLKLDYDTKQVKWAFTPMCGRSSDGSTWARQPSLGNSLIMPDSDDGNFAWFYNQHDANVVSYDPDSGIMELAMFDNGNTRYNFGDEKNGDTYSRMVVYRIDENSKSAKEVYSYGKERGSQLYSWWYGSAQKLSNGHHVGNFALYNNVNTSHIVETDPGSGVVAEYQVNGAANGSYRTTEFDLGAAISNLSLGQSGGSEVHGYKTQYWASSSLGSDDNSMRVNISDLYRDDDTLSVLGSVSGGVSSEVQGISLVASGDGGTYEFPIINCGGGNFYGLGVPLSSLSDGSYSLYMRVKLADGSSRAKSLGKSVSVGGYVSDDIQYSTNIPDGGQESILESLNTSAQKSDFQNMTVVQDPFRNSPLTAMALFSTKDLCSVSVTAHGKDSAQDVSYAVDGKRVLHEIPIVGLYYNDATEVTLTLTHGDGSTETKDLSLTTGTAPNTNKIPNINVTCDDATADQAAPGLTFCAPSGGSYFYAVDRTGAIRWYYALAGNVGIDGVSFTSEDHLLILDGSRSSTAETNNFGAQEIDLLGRVYNEYFLPNMSFHHELKELPNGNLLGSATDYSKDTINDVAVEIDRKSGKIARRWDMDKILANYGISRLATPSFGLPVLKDSTGNPYNQNWFHNNGVSYDSDDDSLIISSRHQSAVFKIDASTSEVKWVLSDPECLKGTGLEPYLLRPVDASGNEIAASAFEWQYGQHAPMICSDGDIALFDNGNFRTKLGEGKVSAKDNYSRVVKFHIDERSKTVSQVWEFGKELGSDHFCALIGDVDELGTDHYLSTFGGHCLTGADGEVSDNPGSPYIESSLFEIKDGKVVWSLSSTPNLPVRSSAIYRSERVNLTKLAYTYDSSYGQMWLGDAGQTNNASIDRDAFVDGLSNVAVTKAVNEGNRVIVSGTVVNPASVKELYLADKASGTVSCHKADVKGNGSFSLAINVPNSFLREKRGFTLYAVMKDGHKLKRDVDLNVSGVGTFSARIDGGNSYSLGDTSQLSLMLAPSGQEDQGASWKSSNESVATVDDDGKLSAVGPGVAIITAISSDSGTRAQLVVNVNGSKLSDTEVVLTPGETADLSVLHLGDALPPLNWTIDDSNIAKLDQNGSLVAKEPGSTLVTVRAGDWSCKATVKVVQPVDDGVYTIVSSLNESKVLDISGASRDNGANLQLFQSNGSAAQQFRITYKGKGAYAIQPLCSDKMIDVACADRAPGTNVWQYASNNTDAQRWRIEKDNKGYVTITSVGTGLCLDVAGAAAIDGVNVQTYTPNGTRAQKFKLSTQFKDGIYRIASRLNKNMVLDVSDGSKSQANIQLWSWNHSDAQMMFVRYAGGGAYEITPLAGGLSVEISCGLMNTGANVQQYQANGTLAQRWFLRPVDNGSYKIVSALSGKCLDVNCGDASDGTNIQVWDDNGTNAQQFDLIECGKRVVIASMLDDSYALDVAGASGGCGANVHLWKRNGTAAQTFYLSDVLSSGERCILTGTGRNSLDVANADTSSGANLWQWDMNGSAAQRWYLQFGGKDGYSIVSALSGKRLDVQWGSAVNGSNVQLYSKNGTRAQQFKLIVK